MLLTVLWLRKRVGLCVIELPLPNHNFPLGNSPSRECSSVLVGLYPMLGAHQRRFDQTFSKGFS